VAGTPPAKRLTLRNVISHTSGLPNYRGLADYHAAVRSSAAPWSESKFLSRTNAGELLFEPDWGYSNIGYMLLRGVLMEVGNGDMETGLRRQIFDPPETTSTSVPLAKNDLASSTFGLSRYLEDDGPPLVVRVPRLSECEVEVRHRHYQSRTVETLCVPSVLNACMQKARSDPMLFGCPRKVPRTRAHDHRARALRRKL
jgi:CubicO group peptidase (beta-lactamase class C family)